MKKILSRDFYERDACLVAQELLGKSLVRILETAIISGIIVESEAYDGEQDLACHAHFGRTRRNEVMYGHGGHAYIYFTYGMHWLFNCVTGKIDYPSAVLIRAIIPVEGREIIRENRKDRAEFEWTNGPAKICQAMEMDGRLNGMDLINRKSPIIITEGIEIARENIENTPRVGINSVPEPWLSKPWRYLVSDHSLLDIK